MDPLTIMSAVSAGKGIYDSFFGSGSKAPQYQGMNAQEMDELINTYRSAGMAGINKLGRSAQQGAVARMAASGQAPTLAMQQGAFTPILERMTEARAGLEGNLAQTRAGLEQHGADMQYQGDMAHWQDQRNLSAGLMDMGATGLLRAYEQSQQPQPDQFPNMSNQLGNQMAQQTQQQLPNPMQNMYPQTDLNDIGNYNAYQNMQPQYGVQGDARTPSFDNIYQQWGPQVTEQWWNAIPQGHTITAPEWMKLLGNYQPAPKGWEYSTDYDKPSKTRNFYLNRMK